MDTEWSSWLKYNDFHFLKLFCRLPGQHTFLVISPHRPPPQACCGLKMVCFLWKTSSSLIPIVSYEEGGNFSWQQRSEWGLCRLIRMDEVARVSTTLNSSGFLRRWREARRGTRGHVMPCAASWLYQQESPPQVWPFTLDLQNHMPK